MFQCYFIDKQGKQCENRQDDYWCSPEHKTAWQAVNYVDNRPRNARKKSIAQIQKRLLEMARLAREKRFKEQQRLL